MMTISHKSSRIRARLHNRLKTTGMVLGLARLLRDAGRTDEARAVLLSLRGRFEAR